MITRPLPPTAAPRQAMTALMVSCVVIVVAMVAAINLAIPALEAGRLHPSSTEMLWVVDAYVLVFGCLLIPAGAAGDRLGRKGALLAGLAVFALGCLLSAVAPSIGVLVGACALTGLGAALVMPATLSLLLQVTPRERKGQAVATWTAGTGAAGVVGGVVLEYLAWPWLFVSVAVLVTVLGILIATVAPPGERHPAALDPAGSGMLVALVFALLFGSIEGRSRGWGSETVLGAFGVAIALTAVFVRRGLRRRAPVLDPRIFAIPSLRIGVLGVAITFFGLFALFFVNAQYLQYVKGYSPLVTGVAILPVAVTVTVVSRGSLVVAGRVGVDRVVTVGLALVVGALGLLSLVGAGTPYLAYAGILVVAGAGLGLCLPALSTSIMVSVPARQAGMGSGLNGAAREIDSALGVAVLGTVMTSVFADRITTAGGGSIERTLHAAARMSPAAHAAAVDDFSAAISTGYRVIGAVVLAATLAIGWALAYDGIGRRVLMQAVLPLAALLAVSVGAIAGTAPASGSGIDKAKLNRSVATAFAHLYVMQTDELHRPAVTEAQLRSGASCDKGGSLVDDVGPGNDWRHPPASDAKAMTLTATVRSARPRPRA